MSDTMDFATGPGASIDMLKEERRVEAEVSAGSDTSRPRANPRAATGPGRVAISGGLSVIYGYRGT